MRTAERAIVVRLLSLLVVLAMAPGCSLRRMAINSVADSLSSAGDVWSSDDDPELIRAATPFALKTTESLLAEAPEHEGLLLSACSGFTQYAYAFVELDAFEIEPESWRRAEELRERALKLYLRGRNYCLRALDLRAPGATERLRQDAAGALSEFDESALPLLFWTAASWGSAISLGLDRPDLVVDLPAVRALIERALTLDPQWNRGSIHEALISIEALPETMGGSPDEARRHFEKAVELSGGTRASPYVTLAEGLMVGEQDRARFEVLLRSALAVDPDAVPSERLANLLAQRRARLLLERTEELFLE